jgi:hypothetical protein
MWPLTPLIASLDALKIPFFIGGSVASSTHGMMRSTQDLDVVADLQEDQIAPLAKELGPNFKVNELALREAVRRRGLANLFFIPEFTRIDLYVAERSPFNDSQMRRRVRVTFIDTKVPVSSPEDTILKKLEWYRRGNEVTQRHWWEVYRVSSEGVVLARASRPEGDTTWSEDAGTLEPSSGEADGGAESGSKDAGGLAPDGVEMTAQPDDGLP